MIILFLIGALGLGRLTVNSLPLAWRRAEAWALIVLFGYLFGTWLLLLACSLFGFRIGSFVTALLMLGSWLLPQTRRPLSLVSFATPRQTAVWLVTTGAFSLLICYLLYREMLEPGRAGGAYSAGGSDWDLPLHLSIITNIAYATRLTWRFSLMAHTYLTYPFLIDFLSGMIVRWGGSLRLGLLIPSIPLCLATIQLMFFLGYRAFKNARAAALFPLLFFLGGSNFGFVRAITDFLHSKSHFWAFFSNPPYDYCFSQYNNFVNFTTNIFLCQRGFQFGLSVFCAAMMLAYQLSREMDAGQRRRILILIGVITGLLPLAHVHSFFMSFAALLVFAWYSRKTIDLAEWLPAAAASLLVALPQLVFQLFANRHASFVRFQPGWTFNDGDFPQFSHYQGLFLYILVNFGLILALAIISYPRLKGYGPIRGFVLLGIALFIAAFLFTFQPSIYDNIKFFIYILLFFSLAIAQYLSQLSRSGKWLWAPLTLLLVASGTLSVTWEARQHWLFLPVKDLEAAGAYRRQLPIDALVLTSSYYKHPLWELAGQPVVEGQISYLSSYGFPAEAVSRDVQAMYAGGDHALSLLRKYRVQYV
jgi:hypothetical protein